MQSSSLLNNASREKSQPFRKLAVREVSTSRQQNCSFGIYTTFPVLFMKQDILVEFICRKSGWLFLEDFCGGRALSIFLARDLHAFWCISREDTLDFVGNLSLSLFYKHTHIDAYIIMKKGALLPNILQLSQHVSFTRIT